MDYSSALQKKLREMTYSSKFDFISDILGEIGISVLDVEGDFLNKSKIEKIIDNTDFSVILDPFVVKKVLGLLSCDEKMELFGMTNIHDIFSKVINKKEVDNKKEIVVSRLDSREKRFFELLDYQVIIKNRVLRLLKSERFKENIIVHMPTGSGKTKTTMHILIDYWLDKCKTQGLILWLAHSKELIQQAYESFNSSWKSLGVGSIESSIYSDDDWSHSYNGIIFMTYQKLSSMYRKSSGNYNDIIEKCKLVVTDEAHFVGAKEWTKPIKEISKKSPVLGLTATPGRTGDLENIKEIKEVFGKVISIDMKTAYMLSMLPLEFSDTFDENYTFEPITELQNLGVLAVLEREKLIVENYKPDVYQALLEVNNYESTLRELSRDPFRNNLILKRLIDVYNEELQTIVFACSNSHAYLLQKLLMVEGIKSEVVTSDTPKNKRRSIIERFKNSEYKILINNRVLTTGFDSPNIECVFITKASDSVITYSQMIGRGLRGPAMGGNKTCRLIDVVDNIKNFDNENTIFKHFNKYWR